jgi:hypothetical protein
VIRCLASREPPQRSAGLAAFRPLSALEPLALVAPSGTFIARWVSAVNCVLADRQNLVQVVNGRAAALHEEQWIVWSCATKQWKEKKPSSAFCYPIMDLWMPFRLFFFAQAVSRCGDAAMRCRCDAHIVRVRRQRARSRLCII